MTVQRKVVLIGLDSVSLPLVEHCLASGARMPAFAAMIRDGVAAEGVSELPAYTPTNWASLATGSRVGTTGAADWVTQAMASRVLSTFDSRAITAETIFEVCAEAGIPSLAIQYPGSWPRRGDGMVVTPLPNGLVSLALAPGVEIVANDVARPGARQVTVAAPDGGPGTAGSLEADVSVFADDLNSQVPGSAVSRAGVKADGAVFEPSAVASALGRRVVARLTLRVTLDPHDEPSVTVADAAGNAVRLPVGAWSDWLMIDLSASEVDVIRGTVRFKLRSLSADGRKFSVVRSEIYPATGFTDPPELAEQLLAKAGPFIENPATLALGHLSDPDIDSVLSSLEGDLAVAFEEAAYQAEWISRAAEYLDDAYGWDLLYLHWHFPDTIIHRLLAAADPQSPAYRRDLAPIAESALRRCLEVADELVARLRRLAGADGYTFVVSDHGNVTDKWWADISVRLLESGLAVAQDDGTLDRHHSDVLPFAPLQLRIRESAGAPGTAEFERIQDAVIDSLLSWRDPVESKRVVALALRRRDAQLLGFWGPSAGDVVFCFNDGFSWPDEPNPIVAGSPDMTPAPLFPNGAHHGPKLPTARSRLSSNTALVLVTGPGVKSGLRWDGDLTGWPRLIDIAPTVAHLLGIRSPRNSHGAVISGLFERTDGPPPPG